jgi:hypothetical protein
LLLAGLNGAEPSGGGGLVKSKPSGETGWGTCGLVKSKSLIFLSIDIRETRPTFAPSALGEGWAEGELLR